MDPRTGFPRQSPYNHFATEGTAKSRERERERERGVDVIDSLSSTISFLDTIQTGRSLWKPDTWGWSALPSNRTSITACRSCRLFVVFDGRWSFLIIRFFSLSLFLVYSVDVFDVIVINFWYESNFYFEYLVRRK